MRENIILIGFMGSGKTSVGRRLADRISFQFIDTDEEIEKEQKVSISRIFEEKGESYFRDLETECIQNGLADVTHAVISTGGGLPMRDENAAILKELGLVVYLNATKESIIRRVKGDTNRPILAGEDLEMKVERLLLDRKEKYEKAAHVVIQTDQKNFVEIINEIRRAYNRYQEEQI